MVRPAFTTDGWLSGMLVSPDGTYYLLKIYIIQADLHWIQFYNSSIYMPMTSSYTYTSEFHICQPFKQANDNWIHLFRYTSPMHHPKRVTAEYNQSNWRSIKFNLKFNKQHMIQLDWYASWSGDRSIYITVMQRKVMSL
jgi:hypothetical protein